ncbi:penicillin-binding transpeptidase domain-containing protein [Bacteroidota bacterium]
MELYSNRKYVFIGLIILISLILIIKLFIIQVVDPAYKISANNNSMRKVVRYPSRGLIYDRNNKLIVNNKASYNLMVIPGQIREFDSISFCNILDIDLEILRQRIKEAKSYSVFKPFLLQKRISAEQSAVLSEKLYKFPGFFIRTVPVREYTGIKASHMVGYMGEIDEHGISEDNFYDLGDYSGISGIERIYEKELRGKKGAEFHQVDVHNRIVGSFFEGRYDTTATAGYDIITGLDSDLQVYVEELMKNLRGSVVAIQPSTGEILTMVSSPFYDPELFVGRYRSENFEKLANDTLDPLFNRAIMSRYSPGSIFKIVQGLIGLQLGVISENTGFPCNKLLMGCHDHPYASDLGKAIQYSCNPYFYEVYKRIIQQGLDNSIFRDSELGIKIWHEHVCSFGFGNILNIDLPQENSGNIPDADFYNNWYGQYRWAFSTIYSNSNGQGELETTPLQIANLAAIIANKGYYYYPHIVKSINGKTDSLEKFRNKIYTSIDTSYFNVALNAMHDVVWGERGTGINARVPGINVCGKTGTVQNVHGEDHSGFFALAPMEKPELALSVYIENAGEGGYLAALISSLIIEKYLKGEIKQKYKENIVRNFYINNY